MNLKTKDVQIAVYSDSGASNSRLIQVADFLSKALSHFLLISNVFDFFDFRGTKSYGHTFCEFVCKYKLYLEDG